MSSNASPLTGLRVLDIGEHPATALASMVLADFGALVVAVPGRVVREHPAAPLLLRGKRVLHEAQGDEYEQVLANADVLLTTLGPDDAAPERKLHQIQLNISGWGMQGPYARYPMREGLVAAKSGRMALFEGQNPRAGPAYAAVQVATFGASQIAVQGILAALMTRARTGCGERVETSLLQGMIPYDTQGLVRAQFETRYPDLLPPEPAAAKKHNLPYQPVQGADGNWLQLGNLLDHLFRNYLKVTGLAEVPPVEVRDKPNATWPAQTIEQLRVAMLTRMRERPAADWLATFRENGNVAAAPYQTTQQALDDPDLTQAGDVVDGQHPTLGAVRWLGPAASLEATPARIAASPSEAAAGGATFALPRQHVKDRAPDCAPDQAPDRAPDRAPLAGITVLEFASIIATPLGCAMLAELGARVIKIEPIGGDPGRRVGGAMALGLGAIKYNAGKESICIELKSPQGREILDKLLPKADLIAHNFRPGVPDKLGFGYERARSFNPKVVWLSANGYDPKSPGAQRPCSHPIAGAQCGGALYQAGAGMPPKGAADMPTLIEAARRLMRANEVNPDPNTSMLVATGAMLGLAAAKRFGIGQRVNVNMMLANVYANFDDAVRYPGKPQRPPVDADLYGLHALYRLYRCAEGWVFLAAEGDAEFKALCQTIGLAALADDNRFRDAKHRRANDAVLAAQLAAAFLIAGADSWERQLGCTGLGCVRADGSVAGDFWLSDPHVRANGLARACYHLRYGRYLRHGPLLNFSDSPLRGGAGTLAGQHTDALLHELGYDETAIEQLRKAKVVWSESLVPLPL
jgi:crotonobetainyl-CoA:carnitine CoA-transferase CaiB-like acyl-CoA transferase